jgi:hypothetical protein
MNNTAVAPKAFVAALPVSMLIGARTAEHESAPTLEFSAANNWLGEAPAGPSMVSVHFKVFEAIVTTYVSLALCATARFTTI